MAYADGGAGGTASAGTGGAGGANSTTGAGGAGGDSSQSNTGTTNGGAGGGGGAGATGGAGGHGAATAPPPSMARAVPAEHRQVRRAANGINGQTFGAGGGGGGAHGYVGATLPVANAMGGAGGHGGDSTGGGGGGGAGGYGAVITGAGVAGTILDDIAGGNGGNGGNGGGAAINGQKGAGGDGGLGLQFTGGGANVTVDGSVTGGNGGSITGASANGVAGPAGDGGVGIDLGSGNGVTIGEAVTGGNGGNQATFGSLGVAGAGGVGIVGQNANVTITSGGSVTGGTGGSGGPQVNAITFTGTNTLTIHSGATIDGAVVGTGSDTFVLGGSTNGSLDITAYQAQFTGFSTFGKSGTSTWSLTNGVISSPVDIDGGKLEFASGALLAGNVDVASGATVAINQAGIITYGGVISGAGGFEQTNAGGTTVFNTNQTYTGTTTIAAGTLQLGVGGTTGGVSSSSDIVNNGTLDVNRSNGITLGNISGTGTLSKRGGGTLTLTGDTTFSSVSVTGGGLQVGSGGATGSIAGDIALSSGTTLTFNRTGTVTYADDVTGGGSFGNDGTGTTILTGAFTNTGTFAVSSGTVQIGDGGSGGSVDLDIINDGALVWNKSADTDYAGGISGSGSLTKSGSGELNLTGINTYIGDTTITAGRLSVNGQIGGGASTTYVDGGVLGGTGMILGTVDVNAGGIHAPGNSIGTQTIAGSYLLNSGSILQIEANAAGQSDQVIVGGTVNLTNAILQVIAAAGTYAPTTEYTIIDNQGGGAVNGSFTTISSNFAFLTPTVAYDGGDGNDVVLTLTSSGSGVQFCAVATSTNQCAVGNAVQKLGAGNPLYDAVIGQTVAGAQQAFNALSGEVYASTATALIDQAHFVRGSIINRLIQSSYSSVNGEVAALGAGGPIAVASRSSQIYDGRMALGAPVGGTRDDPARTMPGYGEGLVFWTQAYGSWGQFDGNGNAATLDRSLGGFVSGVDTGLQGSWRAGFATGYTRTDLSVGARASSSDVDSYLLAAYAGGPVGKFMVRSGATWSWNAIDATRNVIFPGFFETETASYNGNVGQLFAEIAHPYLHGGTTIEPFAGLAWVHFGTDGFTETGGAAALTTAGSNDNVGYSTLGIRAAGTMLAAGHHGDPARIARLAIRVRRDDAGCRARLRAVGRRVRHSRRAAGAEQRADRGRHRPAAQRQRVPRYFLRRPAGRRPAGQRRAGSPQLALLMSARAR